MKKTLLVCLLTLFVPTKVALLTNVTEHERFLENPHYVSNEHLENVLMTLQGRFPTLAKVFSIGQSLEGQNLYVIEIRKDIQQPRPLLMPMFKYVANMHGDEALGRQLLIFLAEYLLSNYNLSSEVTSLVDQIDIFLMPSLNPDGFGRSVEGNCRSLPQYLGRVNSAGIDLNRDFPDPFNAMRLYYRQPETRAMVNWVTANKFVLSASLHGGAIVASYPYDNSPSVRGNLYSPTPDDSIFKHLASTYAVNHPSMQRKAKCHQKFPGGITNGAKWYKTVGGMQDFNYVYASCFDITLELSCCKYPNATSLGYEWRQNKRSLIEYMKLSHMGVKGICTDLRNRTIPDVKIEVEDGIAVYTNKNGEYWRLLKPGTYQIHATASGYSTNVGIVTVTDGKTTVFNFFLA